MRKTLVLSAAGMAVAIVLWLLLGGYNVAATEPHWTITESILEMVRERSIHSRSDDIEVPNLDNESMMLAGAANYDAMCTTCHLAPGMENSELHAGLYPKPPKLFSPEHGNHDPAATFWVIKNGIKMTGMPAWGPTHDDDAIWSMVAFLQKLPTLDAEGYRALVAKAKAAGHGHGGADHHHGSDNNSDSAQHSEHAHGDGGHHHTAQGHEHATPAAKKTGHSHGDAHHAHTSDHHGAQDTGAAHPESPEQSFVRERMQAYVAAVNRMDIEAIESFILDDADFMVVEGTHENRGWANYRDTHLVPEFKVLQDFSYKLMDTDVQVDGNTAIVAFTYEIKARIKERKLEKVSKGTAIWKRVDGQWLLHYIHTS